MVAEPKQSATAHAWSYFTLGRRCERCGITQERGVFDDAVPCEPRHRLRRDRLAITPTTRSR